MRTHHMQHSESVFLLLLLNTSFISHAQDMDQKSHSPLLLTPISQILLEKSRVDKLLVYVGTSICTFSEVQISVHETNSKICEAAHLCEEKRRIVSLWAQNTKFDLVALHSLCYGI